MTKFLSLLAVTIFPATVSGQDVAAVTNAARGVFRESPAAPKALTRRRSWYLECTGLSRS